MPEPWMFAWVSEKLSQTVKRDEIDKLKIQKSFRPDGICHNVLLELKHQAVDLTMHWFSLKLSSFLEDWNLDSPNSNFKKGWGGMNLQNFCFD